MDFGSLITVEVKNENGGMGIIAYTTINNLNYSSNNTDLVSVNSNKEYDLVSYSNFYPESHTTYVAILGGLQ